MRIERHEVRAEALAKATRGFTDEIGGAVHREQEAGRDLHGWDIIAGDLLDYAGARSAERPGIDTDAFTALYSAAEARIGALTLDHAPASASFSVHTTYTGTGVVYEGRGEGGDTGPSTPPTRKWIEALYLCLVAGIHEQNAGALISLASTFDEGEVLARGLACYLFPEVGAERDQILGYVGSAVTGMAQDGRVPHPDLMQLHTLLSGEEELFWKLMTARLQAHRDGASAERPASLLPVGALAFAAMAVRKEGWEQPLDTDYLPRRLVLGEERRGAPRVGAYGADKDAGALRELARGRLVVGREADVPEHVDRILERWDRRSGEGLERIWRPQIVPRELPGALQRSAEEEIRRFRYRSLVDPQARDPRQLEALTHASQYTAAAFASVTSKEDTVEVTLGPTTAPLRAVEPTRVINEGARVTAVEYAVLSGARERLDALLAHPAGAFDSERDGGGISVFRLYPVALLAYLRAEVAGPRTAESGARDVEPLEAQARGATDDALAALPRYQVIPGFPPPPVVPLSQLVAGDREGFALALADALEAHRDAFSAGDKRGDSRGLVNTRLLALACLARARGWDVPVESDYLPRGVLDHAAGLLARPA
ncbi:Imm49 family immunity protein [Nocardiopsis sp. FIRDI 009]|uniref:Imm49 family immunity protein n=1 Tax=Nocardiopsis sp. FIRDI 009 TaxID=714197 RepID=UPI000E26F2DA|nr:Imm49 family immunity protein [Nocardiopsis sp. FIRDI 009]